LKSARLEFEVAMTKGAGDATQLARAAVKASRPLVVAAGGDGTIHEVVNGFFEAGVRIPTASKLGVLPSGTGGDFRRTFDLPIAPEPAARALLAGKTRRIDAGKASFTLADGARGIRHFVNIADAGVAGEVVNRVNRSAKRLGSYVTFNAAAIASLLSWTNKPMKIVVDGEAFEARCQQVVIANCRYYGGGMQMAPMAVPDDGLLDVIVIGDVGRFYSLSKLDAIRKGTHLDMGDPRLKVLRGTSVEVSSAERVLVDLDGEQPGMVPATFEVMPGSIDLVVPEP
jgi:YegS/Rv2252/BmrU family lipid kinase